MTSNQNFFRRVGNALIGDDFFTSPLYLFLLAAATLVTWYTGILWIVIAVYAVALLVISLTQKTMVGLLPIAGTFVFGYSERQRDVMADMKTPILIASIFIGVVLICCIVWFIKNRKSVSFGYFPKVPYLLLFGCLVLGGVGAGFWFTPQWFGGVAIGAVCLLALVVLTSANRKPIDKEFLCRILLMMGCVVVAQTFLFYYKQYLAGNLEEAILRKTLDYGWNMSNGGGMMIIMAVPVIFYYATKRKLPILEGILFVIFVFALIMTNSRGAQVAFLVIILPTILYSFAKSKSKPRYLIAILLVAAMTGGLLLLMYKLDSGFIERWTKIGLNDSGRFNIYESCLKEIFSGNFLFGWGFFHPIPNVVWNNFLAHNTILQFWADFGLLGLVAFVALIIGNYGLVLKKNGNWGIMMALALLAPGIHAMLDVNYFTPFYMPILIVFVVIASNVREFRVKDEKAKAELLQNEKAKAEQAAQAKIDAENEIPHIQY